MDNYILANSQMSVFTNSNNIGKIGESIVRKIFLNNNFTVEYNTNQSKLELNNYDLYCYKNHQSIITERYLEVKTDLKADLTGNIFWEMEVNGKPGWTQKYTQDSIVFIVWVFPISHKLIFLPAKYLYLVQDDKYSRQEVKVNKYEAWGYLIPVKDVEMYSKVKHYNITL